MRAVLAALLLAACSTPQEEAHTKAVVDETAHALSDAAPLLVLIPGAGPACSIALKAACAVAEEIAEWPEGPGLPPTP